MTLRTAHGAGASALVRVERRPLDEIPAPKAEDVAEGLVALAKGPPRGRPFQKGHGAARGRKPSLAALGVPLVAADPRYQSALRKAASYRSRRCRELAIEHGGYLGAGPASMLASAALALAASRVLYELAGATLDPALFVQAAQLADKARQQELTAVDLAARDAKGRERKPRDLLADFPDPSASNETK